MPGARRPHVQLALRYPDENRERRGRRTGVPSRRGARLGRPRSPNAGSPHKTRPELKARFPVHVVLRVVREIGSLRKRHMYKALREATLTLARRELFDRPHGAFRIIHISIQRTHVHLIVEADHKHALSNGMQRFQISAAKHLNAAASRGNPVRRRGTVFPDRFHQEIITNPTQARRTLAYVINNWRKHQEDRSEGTRRWNVDPFSTGVLFWGWKEREGTQVLWRWRPTYLPLVVYQPRTWLLREGWRRGGSLVAFREVPSSRTIAEVRA